MDNDVIKIEEFIWSKIEKEKRIGLLNGLSGIGLLYKYLIEWDSQKYTPKLTYIIEKIENIISEEETLPSICSGLAGYGFLLVHLKDIIAIDESYFMDIDEILLEFLKLQSDDYDYDFLHGSLGIGLYFVERHSITNNDYTKKIITEFYTNLLRNIQNNFENVISQKEIDGANSLYFGLAHGIAGILNSIYSSNRYIDFNQDLLKKSILKLLDVLVKNELNNEFFKYPNYYDLDNNLIIKSRLAWCQGDLGIGNSLMNSGLLLEDNDLYFKGQKIISRTFDLDINRCGINDVGICHGISGVLLQKWLYYEKSNIANKSSTTIWREYLKKQTKNYSDFKAFHKGKYVDEINLLEGATGIALTKLTIENKINKNWISCLNLI